MFGLYRMNFHLIQSVIMGKRQNVRCVNIAVNINIFGLAERLRNHSNDCLETPLNIEEHILTSRKSMNDCSRSNYTSINKTLLVTSQETPRHSGRRKSDIWSLYLEFTPDASNNFRKRQNVRYADTVIPILLVLFKDWKIIQIIAWRPHKALKISFPSIVHMPRMVKVAAVGELTLTKQLLIKKWQYPI